MKQRLHANLAPIDILTRLDLEEVADKHFSAQTRERFRGIDAARLPPIAVTSTAGGTLNLYAGGASDGDAGPEQGDVWFLRRANVASSAFTTDFARYVLFRGSSPSDPVNGYTNRQLLTTMNNNGVLSVQTAVTTPNGGNVPANGVAFQSPYGFPVQVVIAANGATISQVTVNSIIVGGSAGTYYIPAYGAIAISYTVATPTWVWTAASTPSFTPGNVVGIEYDSPNKGGLFQPGEQLYAQVFNTTIGNTYLLSAEFIRVPAEMKGKILG